VAWCLVAWCLVAWCLVAADDRLKGHPRFTANIESRNPNDETNPNDDCRMSNTSAIVGSSFGIRH